jgi:hypothetical protein
LQALQAFLCFNMLPTMGEQREPANLKNMKPSFRRENFEKYTTGFFTSAGRCAMMGADQGITGHEARKGGIRDDP